MSRIMNSQKVIISGVLERMSLSSPTCGTRHDLHKIIGNQLYNRDIPHGNFRLLFGNSMVSQV